MGREHEKPILSGLTQHLRQFEYVSQSGTTQQWRLPSALEVVWRGENGKLLSLKALPKQRIEAIDHTEMLG
jgi:hypothetical protein